MDLSDDEHRRDDDAEHPESTSEGVETHDHILSFPSENQVHLGSLASSGRVADVDFNAYLNEQRHPETLTV